MVGNILGKKKREINVSTIIALTLLKEWGFKINAYRIIRLNRKFNLKCFKVSKPTLYKYSKAIEREFNEVKKELRGTRFLEEY
ncbi:MAG: hypothetical protein QW648_03245 [Nanoarchaeales archaeon]